MGKGIQHIPEARDLGEQLLEARKNTGTAVPDAHLSENELRLKRLMSESSAMTKRSSSYTDKTAWEMGST